MSYLARGQKQRATITGRSFDLDMQFTFIASAK